MKSVKILAGLTILSLLSFQNCANRLISDSTPVIDYSSVQSILPDCEFNRIGLVQGETVKAYQSSTVLTGQTCRFEIRACQNGILSGSYQYGLCMPGAPAACLMDGKTIPHGATIKVYKAAALPYGELCENNFETRTCTNGNLPGTFTAIKCVTQLPTDCSQVPPSIPNGQARRFYQSATVPFASACVPQTRTCTNGILSGSYTNAGCTPEGPSTCMLNGTVMQHNEVKQFFDRATVPFGQVCPVSVPRTCTNGTVSGSTAYIHIGCTVDGAADCYFNGTKVVHLSSIKAYQYSTLPAGQNCETSTQMRKCTNGTFDGTYLHSDCTNVVGIVTTPTPTGSASCRSADGVEITHNTTPTLYKSKLFRGSESCRVASNSEVVHCDNGTLSGSARLANCDATKVAFIQDGGTGGNPFDNVMCPSGVNTTGIFPSVSGDITSIALLCATGTSNRGGGGDGAYVQRTCPSGTVLVGIRGQIQYGWTWRIQGICAVEDGTGQVPLQYDGTDFAAESFKFTQICKPGWVVNKVYGRVGGAIDAIGVECIEVTAGANLDCLGEWVDQGCSLSASGPGKEQFFITRRKSGNGAECSASDRQQRETSRDCTPYHELPGGE